MRNAACEPLPPLRLLMLAPGRIASTQILESIFSGLAEQGAIDYHSLFDNESSPAEQQAAIWKADVLFFFRSYTPTSLSLSRFAKKHGKAIIYSTDDDFRALDPNTPLGQVHHHPENFTAYEAFFREADLVWLFSEEMKRRYEPLNGTIIIGRLPSFVERNCPDLPDSHPTAGQNDCVIGYGGSHHHYLDWQVLINPLRHVLDSYPHVRAEFIHYAPDALARHPKVRLVPFFQDLVAYHTFLRQAQWAIGLAPLADTDFNRGKTNNKYREYAGLGIPAIYSNVPVYASCVTHEETGYVAPHSEDGFRSALQTLIEDPDLRMRIRLNALQDAASTYSLRGAQLQFLREASQLAIRQRCRNWRRPSVLIVGHDQVSSTHFDGLQPCRRLEQQRLLQFSWLQPLQVNRQRLEEEFSHLDGVYVIRAFQPEVLPLLDWARDHQVPLISAWDDDFFSMPAGTPLGNYYRQPSVVAATERFLRESSMVIASTPPLVTRSRQLTPRVLESLYGLDAQTLSTFLPTQQRKRIDDGRVRIGFYGANAAIEEPWLVEALHNIRKRYGERVVLEVIGSSPPQPLATELDWYYDKLLPYEESMRMLHSRGWDIGLAPLEDSPFNAAKQATKFRDYTWAGATIVYSQVPAYERTLINRVHCLFAQNTSTAWEEAISFLVENPDRADFLRKGAKKLLEAVHVQEMTNAGWYQIIWRLGVTADTSGVAPILAPVPVLSGEDRAIVGRDPGY